METPALQALGLQLPPRLRDLNLTLHRGEICGLLGINGAGKSSALMALAGVLPGVRGALRVHGQELAGDPTLRRHIGWLPQHPPLYPELSVYENLTFFAGLRGITRRATLERQMRRFELEPLAQRLARRLSGGEQMRLALACVLIHEPDILLLDEPTAGLDPVQTAALHALIRREREQRCIVLASHLLPDIEALCQRAVLMHAGRIVADEALVGSGQQVRITLAHPPARDQLLALAGVRDAQALDSGHWLLHLSEDAPPDLLEQIAGRGWGLRTWEPQTHRLLVRFRALSSGETT
jgi:ABC-2 type transport system ATP-binding protein